MDVAELATPGRKTYADGYPPGSYDPAAFELVVFSDVVRLFPFRYTDKNGSYTDEEEVGKL